MTGLTESERDALGFTHDLSCHMDCAAACSTDVCTCSAADQLNTVEWIIAERVAAERERIARLLDLHVLISDTYAHAARIARQEPQNAAQDGRGGLERTPGVVGNVSAHEGEIR